jgi:hypothetical protein
MLLTFAVIPPLLAKTALKSFYERLGSTRYTVFVVLMIFGALLPVKMYLRWFFNLKYIISMPDFFFNF